MLNKSLVLIAITIFLTYSSKDQKCFAQSKKVDYSSIEGKPAYNFCLKDSSGNFHQLKNFKGKVLVIHFWSTGCGPCVGLEKMLKPIEDSILLTRNDIVFVNVSADEDIKTWKKGLQSGMYTNKNELSLYANGESFAHKLFQYYNVTGIPRTVIIDRDGKTLSAKAPIPAPQYKSDFINLLK